MKNDEIKENVRKGYGKIAKESGSCCGGGCGCAEQVSKRMGYSNKDLGSVPKGANLGLGCGNPVALASLKVGETVLDLGSGAGFDCFLASKKVGPKGKVIGVDMTPEMLERARKSALGGGFRNVEFRAGEIESLPVEDRTVDVVISNCVINLSPDKEQVFSEIYRVLKKGGRFVVSDIALTGELPEELRKSVAAYVGCIAGAVSKDEYLDAVKDAGFKDVRVVEESEFPLDCVDDPAVKSVIDGLGMTEDDVKDAAGSVVSIKVSGKK